MVKEKQEEARSSQKDNRKTSPLFRAFFLFFIPLFLYGETLYLSISANPSRLNPILSSDSQSSEISSKIFSGLLQYAKDGRIVPDIAKEFYFEDNRTLFIRMREDVRWHDGAPLDVEDVIFTYEKILSPNLYSPYSSSYEYVQKIERIDDYALRVHYKEPYFRALELWLVGLLPKHLLEDEEDLMSAEFNKAPSGSGPYMLERFAPSTDILLQANPDYYKGAPRIKKLHYKFVPESATRFLMLKAGELDTGSLTPLQYTRQIGREFKERYAIHQLQGHSYSYMGFNLKREIFQDRRVREAISLSVNREKIIEIMLFGYGDVATGPFLKDSIGYNSDVPKPEFDPKRARELLEAAGYREDNPLEFTLYVPSGGSGKYIAQIIQYQLQQVGVKMRLRSMEWQAFLNTVIGPREFDAVLMAWSMSLTPNPYTIWHSDSMKKGGFNFIGYSNPRLDELIEESQRLIAPEALSEKLEQVHEIIAEDIPYIFIYSPRSIVAVDKGIKNIEPSLIGIMHNLHEWEKTGEQGGR